MNSSELLSTRLFPKQRGPSAVVLTGLAARCDWVVVTDWQQPLVELRRNRETEEPATIFLSMRQPYEAVRFMATCVLPRLRQPFVLISGSEDVTLPLQCDQRSRPFTAAEDAQLLQIATHPLLRRWYAENLDWPFAPKLSPLPLGVLPASAGEAADPALLSARDAPPPPPLLERPLLVLCANRLRPGPQWAERQRLVQQLQALNHPWIAVHTEEMPGEEYARQLRRCSFVICAAGGGWDPCPKLWHALLHGAIPIVRHSALDACWQELPVWIVDDWRRVDWSHGALLRQRQRLAECWPAAADLQWRLSLLAWWQRLQQARP